MNELANFIQTHRVKKDLSRRKLAELAGISHTEIHRLENGERKSPSPPLLKSIAIALGVPYDDIMRAAGYMEDTTPKPVIAAHIDGLDELSEDELTEVRNYISYLRHKREE